MKNKQTNNSASSLINNKKDVRHDNDNSNKKDRQDKLVLKIVHSSLKSEQENKTSHLGSGSAFDRTEEVVE
jgi:hypothetical protein